MRLKRISREEALLAEQLGVPTRVVNGQNGLYSDINIGDVVDTRAFRAQFGFAPGVTRQPYESKEEIVAWLRGEPHRFWTAVDNMIFFVEVEDETPTAHD